MLNSKEIILSDKTYMKYMMTGCNTRNDSDLADAIINYDTRVEKAIMQSDLSYDCKNNNGFKPESLSKLGKLIQKTWNRFKTSMETHLQKTGSEVNRHPDGSIQLNFNIIIASDPIIKHHVSKNTLSNTISVYGMDYDKGGSMFLRTYLENAYHITPKNTNTIYDALNTFLLLHSNNRYNPVKQYLLTVEKWDGKKRIGDFAHHFLGASNTGHTGAYNSWVMTRWVVGAVARALTTKPILMEMMPIFVGGQGIGKTQAVNALAGVNNSHHSFSFNKGMGFVGPQLPKFDISDPEVIRALRPNWIMPVDELSGLNRTKLDQFKTFMSTESLSSRRLYANKVSHFPMHNAFIGTTNQQDIIKDETGNRREFPIQCADSPVAIKHPSYMMSSHYIYQFWAEAYYYYKQYKSHENDRGTHKPWVPTQHEMQMADKYIFNQFTQFDPVEAKLRKYLNIKVPTDWSGCTTHKKVDWLNDYDDNLKDAKDEEEPLTHITFVTEAELISVVSGQYDTALRLSHSNSGRKVSMAMRVICSDTSWTHCRKQVNGVRERGWKRPMPHKDSHDGGTHPTGTKPNQPTKPVLHAGGYATNAKGDTGYYVAGKLLDGTFIVQTLDKAHKTSTAKKTDLKPCDKLTAHDADLPFKLNDSKKANNKHSKQSDKKQGKSHKRPVKTAYGQEKKSVGDKQTKPSKSAVSNDEREKAYRKYEQDKQSLVDQGMHEDRANQAVASQMSPKQFVLVYGGTINEARKRIKVAGKTAMEMQND